MSGTLKFSLDRIENGVAVCLLEGEAPVGVATHYELPLDTAPALRGLADGTLFEATIGTDGRLHNIRPLQDETALRRERNKARLQAILARSKKKN